MSALTDLIATVVVARETESWRDLGPEEAASEALADYCIAHAADIAERERLEAAVVDAYEHWQLNDVTRREYQSICDKLTAFLIAQADAEAQP